MIVEVRCCCEPGKLLGWVDVEPERIVEGRTITFAFLEAPAIEPLRSPELPSRSLKQIIEARVRRLEAPVPENVLVDAPAVTLRERRSYLALDSGHRPLEVWRNVRGFRANNVRPIGGRS